MHDFAKERIIMKLHYYLIAAALFFSSAGCSTASLPEVPNASQQTLGANYVSQAQILSIVKSSCTHLKRVEEAGEFTETDEKWLVPLRRVLGRDTIVLPDPDNLGGTKEIDCKLTVEALNKHEHSARSLRLTLQAMLDAAKFSPRQAQDKIGSYNINNPEIAKLIKPSYNSKSFARLFDRASEKGCFELNIDPNTGLVATSGGAEVKEMSERQWVTDTVRTGVLEKEIAPDKWVKVLNLLARFYTNETEQAGFKQCISEPSAYREGGPEVGVAHIFYPATLERDPAWFNNKRLESHALALDALAQGIIDGAEGKAYGIAPQDVNDKVLDAIASLTAYLIAIDYASAPSAGNWEETPFPGGLTWDTAAACRALHTVRALLYLKNYDDIEGMKSVRAELLGHEYKDYLTGEKLTDAISSGFKRIQKTYLAESPGHREIDSSLVFLSCSELCLSEDGDSLSDVKKRLQILEELEDNLVRSNGMIRYAPFNLQLSNGSAVRSPDSYLTLNYNIACDPDGKLNLQWKSILDEFGSKDASEPKVFAARAALSRPDMEAEWFMISDAAYGYAYAAKKILEHADLSCCCRGANPRTLSPSESRLFSQALSGATRNINRAYARITPEGLCKANGLPSPEWAVPEAWQNVSTIYGDTALLPGVNTPLTWAKVSLWGASREFAEMLEKAESMGIKL